MEQQKRSTILRTEAGINYTQEEADRIDAAPLFEKARMVYNKINKRHDIDAKGDWLAQGRVVSQYYRMIPSQFLVELSRSKQDDWSYSMTHGTWKEWAEVNGYITTADIPYIVKPMLNKDVSFGAFEECWLNAQHGVALVNPEESFLEGRKTWIQHIAEHANWVPMFRKGATALNLEV